MFYEADILVFLKGDQTGFKEHKITHPNLLSDWLYLVYFYIFKKLFQKRRKKSKTWILSCFMVFEADILVFLKRDQTGFKEHKITHPNLLLLWLYLVYLYIFNKLFHKRRKKLKKSILSCFMSREADILIFI